MPKPMVEAAMELLGLAHSTCRWSAQLGWLHDDLRKLCSRESLDEMNTAGKSSRLVGYARW